MIRLIKYAIQHPVSILMGALLSSIFGIISLYKIPLEVYPRQMYPQLTLRASWGRTAPEMVQKNLTAPLEGIAMQIKDVRNVASISELGASEIILTFPESRNLDMAYLELGEKLSAARDQFSGEIHFRIDKTAPEEEESEKRPFVSLEFSGAYSLRELRHFAGEKCQAIFQGIPGVARVAIVGGEALQVLIKMDPQRARYYQLDSGTIGRILQQFSQRKGLGYVRGDEGRIYLFLEDTPGTLAELRNIPVYPGVTLSDAASIDYEMPPEGSISRYNFNPLVSLNIYKIPGYHSLQLSRILQNTIASLQEELPPGLILRISDNQADRLTEELKALGLRTVVILAVMVLILLFFFREIRLILLIFGSILFAVFICGIGIYFAGFSLNVVILSGLALALGIWVDNSVVIVENIRRLNSSGQDIRGAVFRGTAEMMRPLFASALTTLAVFMLFLFFRDRLQIYFVPLAWALAFALAGSLLVSLTLTPALGVYLIAPAMPRRALDFHWYRRWVQRILQQRYAALLVFLLLGGVGLYLFIEKIDRNAFFNWRLSNQLWIGLHAPKGVELATLDEILQAFEQEIRQDSTPKVVKTFIAEAQAYGEIRITFPGLNRRDLRPYRLKNRLEYQSTHYAGVGIAVSGFGDTYFNGEYHRGGGSYSTCIEMTGGEYEQLKQYAQQLLEQARQNPRVRDGRIYTSQKSIFSEARGQYVVQFNEKSLRHFRLTRQELFQQLLPLIRRHSMGELRLQDQRFDLLITLQKKEPALSTLKQWVFYTAKGEPVPLLKIAVVQKEAMPQSIDRKNQRYRVFITWDFIGSPILRSAHEEGIIETTRLSPGYTIEKKEDNFLSRQEEKQLFHIILIAVIAVFMILACLYESCLQPLIILAAVPFSFIGICFFYYLAGRNFDINAYIGSLLLIGIVVNNAILLVDHINVLRQKGTALIEAIVQGSQDRIRPICITTFTTIGGLIPVMLMETGLQKSNKILQGLSFATVSGLLSSMLLSITIIPVLYYAAVKIQYMRSNSRL